MGRLCCLEFLTCHKNSLGHEGISLLYIETSVALHVAMDHELLGQYQSRSGHICHHRHDGTGLVNRLRASWLLPAHLFAVLVVTFIITDRLDGQSFPVQASDKWNNYQLQQSDVNGLMSTGLIVVRIFGSSWQLLAVWRCVYILLEKSRLSLAQLSNILSYKILFVPQIRRQDGALFVLITWVIMLLLWPAQLIAPLATSSVSWIPDTIISSSSSNQTEILIGGAGAGWDNYQIYSQARMAVVLRAVAIASIAQLADSGPETEATNVATAIRRVIPSCQGLPNGTLVQNVTTPFINLTSFEWVEDPLSLPSEVQDAVTNGDGDQLSISGYWGNPLAMPYPGVAAPLKTVPWASMSNPNPGSHFPYPAGETFAGQKLVAVLVARDSTSILPGAPSNGTFGQLPDTGFLTVNYTSMNLTNWYAIANVSIRAGVTICDGCRLVSPTVVESTNRNQTMLADPLTNEAFNLMPEVMMVMALMNASASDPSGRLEDFTKSVVARGYQASWNALNDKAGTLARIATQKPHTAVRASVLKSRMYMWAGINLLLSLSGGLLIFVQRQCIRKPVVDTNIAAIMMDSSPLLEQDVNGLCNAVMLGKKDNRLKMLRLRKGVEQSGWSHDVLVNETRERQN